VNKQISKIAIFALLLLAALVVATTYWQAWAAPSLAAKQDNSIQRVAQFEIKRGIIYASDGKTVLASNVAKKQGGQTLYFRRYPTGGFASQSVGYSTQGRSRAGLERSENAYLTASNANLGTIWSKLGEQLRGATIKGNNLVLNLKVGAQKVAESALRGSCGAAVALNPKTGQVYVMASSPSYNPNQIESNTGFAHILKAPSACPGSSSALLNRATQGLYPPGSTFKTVTAAAALDDHVFGVNSSFYDPGYCTEYGQKVSNALNPDQTSESYGHVSFLQAYQHSINAVFCNIGKALGAKRVIDKAKQFGLYSTPPIELPSDEVAPSGEVDFAHHSLLTDTNKMDPGRLAFGQDKLLVTPLQMALVAAGIANGGTIMTPHVMAHVTDQQGSVLEAFSPKPWLHATSAPTASSVTAMMELVTQGNGTATDLVIPGTQVAAKTGTAQTGQNTTDDWMVAFAPANAPKVVVAVSVPNQAVSATGAAVAGPITLAVLKAALGGP
jgi:peptidoglycan glycosyltransferase